MMSNCVQINIFDTFFLIQFYAVSAIAPTEHSDNKTDFLRILTNYKF